jgi:DNA-binding HxlR family transcriptional regulator
MPRGSRIEPDTERPSEECPAAAALELLGRKWTGYILWALLDRPRRYTEILRAVPDIADRVLSARLKELERVGIVTRRQYPEVPPRVEYSLTPRGRDLAPIIEEMARWSRRWGPRAPRRGKLSPTRSGRSPGSRSGESNPGPAHYE